MSIDINWSLFGPKSSELGNTVILILSVVSGVKLFKRIVPLSTSSLESYNKFWISASVEVPQ